MFESAELGHAIDAKTYDAEVPKLREALLAAQSAAFEHAQYPIIVLIAGVEAAGKGDTLHMLHEWMDPRHIVTFAEAAPDCIEREHPRMWRFWKALPRAGEIGVFFGAWYREAVYGRVYDHEKRAALERRLDASSGCSRTRGRSS
jgi:polyphosphate kinase 2 (PPK2 family)